MSSQESAPLLGGGSTNGSSKNNTYYFQDPSKATVGQSDSVRDQDGGLTVEQLPPGAAAGDFEPRSIGAVTKVRIRRCVLLFMGITFLFPNIKINILSIIACYHIKSVSVSTCCYYKWSHTTAR